MSKVKTDKLAKLLEDVAFLPRFKRLVSSGASRGEIADALAVTPAEFEELLEDPIVTATWQQARLDLVLDLKESLLVSAKAGKLTAISRVESVLRGELERGSGDESDVDNLTTVQLQRAIGRPRSSIDRWRRDHGLQRSKEKTYSLPGFFQWFENFCRAKFSAVGSGVAAQDRLREARARFIEQDMRKRRSELLDRGQVISGFVARWRLVVDSFNKAVRELPIVLENQPAERMRKIMDKFFDDTLREFAKIPESLELPPAAAKKLAELFEILKGDES